MCLETIDLLYKRLHDDHVNFGDIVAFSGAGKWVSCVNDLFKPSDEKNSNTVLLVESRPCRTIVSRRILIPEGSYMARSLSTTDCKRLENGISNVGTAKYLVEYTQLIGICSTDTSVAPPEIYERTAQARISLVSSFIPPRQQWAPEAHLHLSLRPELILQAQLYLPAD